MKKPVLIVIAGPNGSGKTTITRRVIKHEWAETCEYINPDEIAQNKFGDWNDKEAVLRAVKYCEERRAVLLQEHKDIIFETVLSAEDKVCYLEKAKQEGYFIRVFFICTNSPEINAARVANRVMKGGHDVPITKIISRYQKSIANIAKVVRFADRVYFYDNSIENHEAQPLFRTINGAIAKQYTTALPEWVKTIYDSINNEI